MPTVKDGQISLYYHFNKIIKGPRTSFQSQALSQKHARHVCHTVHQHLKKFHFDSKHKCNFRDVAMPMMTSQILQSLDFTKTQKSRYLEKQTLLLLQIGKFINCTSRATLLQKNRFAEEITFKKLEYHLVF